MLGRLQMSVDDCITAYTTLADKVFAPVRHRLNFWGLPWNWQVQGRFDGEVLAQCIRDILRSKDMPPDSLLKDKADAVCKV